MNLPRGDILHSARSPFPVCVLPALHTESQPLWRGKHFLYSFSLSGITVACFTADRGHATRSCCSYFVMFFRKVRGDAGCLCRMHVKSGAERAFRGIHTKLSAGQQAFFLCLISHEPLLLGQSPLCVPVALGWSAQRFEIAFERWGFFISIRAFRSCSQPSLLSLH